MRRVSSPYASSFSFGPGPLSVQFDGTASSDPDAQSLTYAWNFGNGSAASSQQSPLHVFTAPGSSPTNYLVTLTVTDSGGLSASATLNVAVTGGKLPVGLTTR